MTPKYESIRQDVLKQIRSGALRADEKLPDEGTLACEYGVSLITVRRAMSMLAQEGHIRRVRGRGSFVSRLGETGAGERVIALMLNHRNNASVSITRIVSGVQQALSARGYKLLVDWNVMSEGIERVSIDRMLNNNVEGFIIYPFDPVKDAQHYAHIRKNGTPYVLLDRYDYKHPCEYIGSNNFDGGMLAARALIERKHEKLACCVNLFFLSSEQERFAGFRFACDSAGLPGVSLVRSEQFGDLAKLARERGVTGMFCVSDRTAARVIDLLTAGGLRVPEDVSVIGFDDCLYDNARIIDFASIRQDFHALGRAAAERLMQLIAGASTEPHTKTLIDVSFVYREGSLRERRP